MCACSIYHISVDAYVEDRTCRLAKDPLGGQVAKALIGDYYSLACHSNGEELTGELFCSDKTCKKCSEQTDNPDFGDFYINKCMQVTGADNLYTKITGQCPQACETPVEIRLYADADCKTLISQGKEDEEIPPDIMINIDESKETAECRGQGGGGMHYMLYCDPDGKGMSGRMFCQNQHCESKSCFVDTADLSEFPLHELSFDKCLPGNLDQDTKFWYIATEPKGKCPAAAQKPTSGSGGDSPTPPGNQITAGLVVGVLAGGMVLGCVLLAIGMFVFRRCSEGAGEEAPSFSSSAGYDQL